MKRAVLMFLLAVTGLLAAQEQNGAPGGEPTDEGQAPAAGPGVARLSLIHGDVSMQRGDSGDWVATSVNTPVVSGDVVATSAGSRAEVQLDFADVLRIAGQTQAKVSDLTRNHIQLQISQGDASLSMFQGGDADVEVDAPNVTIHPSQNGRYLIQVNSDSETNVIVRTGQAEVSTPQGSTTVSEGEMITIRGTDDPEYKVNPAPEQDDWDRWNHDRDNLIRSAEGARRTNQYYTGTQDLDQYGHWVDVPNYGQVWTPYEQPSTWAPYQAGRWVWEPYYGWTWVSYEPWGWAPYHYGRWFAYGSSWYWWPGPVTPVYAPVWSPAFVSFIGFGPHIGFGFGFGTIGWFPLAPFEVFHPWWGAGFNRFGYTGFVEHPFVARGGYSNLRLALNNPRLRGGITTVSAQNFGRGPAVFGHGVDEAALRGAHIANGNLGIVPSHESLTPTSRGFRPAPAGIRSAGSAAVFNRNQPARPASNFREETNRMQQAIQSHGGEGQFGGRAQSGLGSAARFGNGNEVRNDRPVGAGRFGGNERGARSSGVGRDGGFRPFSGGSSRGGSFENRGTSVTRNDRPGVGAGGGSRPPLDLSKRIVVPRNNNSSFGSPNGFGGRGSDRPGISREQTSFGSGAPRVSGRAGNYGAFGGGVPQGGGGRSSYGGGRSYGGGQSYGGGRASGGGSRGGSGGGRASGGGHNGGGHGGGGHR
jgi:FecR protein